ncbi:MAG: hypothetical protein M8467_05310 [Anaerolineae bacterium]|nr:hypothetical protein [Anaerolineae bacterium]
MEKFMLSHTRQQIHMGINYLFSPIPVINRHSLLRFQQNLVNQGIDFGTASLSEPELTVIRDRPNRLEIKIAALGQPPLAQFLVVSPQVGCDVAMFRRDVEAVLRAFESTWESPRRQVISCDATFRDLYETSAEHAFQEIWEVQLGQPAEALMVFGRPVLGGGLRFVMPPQQDDPEPVTIEVKIESYLRDTKKLIIETQFTWPSPSQPGMPFEPASRLRQVDDYVETQVTEFLMGGADARER